MMTCDLCYPTRSDATARCADTRCTVPVCDRHLNDGLCLGCYRDSEREDATRYPIRVPIGRDALEEFSISECGRWEDAGRPEDGEEWRDDEGEIGGPLAYNILSRWKTRVEIRSAAEFREIAWALATGTFQVHKPRAAQALADRLKPLADERGIAMRPARRVH